MSAQHIAKNILDQLDELVRLGKLQPHQVAEMRSHLDPVARPAPPPITARKPPAIPTSAPRKQCRALWSYAAADVDELTFSEDDQVEIVEEVDASWWKGCVVRPDGSRSDAGLFPSNYVEAHPNPITAPPVPARNLLSPPLPARNTPPVYSPTHPVEQQQQPSSYTDEKQMQGLHGQTMAMPSPYNAHGNQPAWQQSGGSPWPTSPGPPSNQSYYHQQHDAQAAATQGPSNPALYGTQQPTSTPEEDKKKQDKLKKFGGRMGQTVATSFVGGVGFGVGSSLFH